jgi:hypothetical protein
VAGTQYAWKPSATRPPDVDGLLVFLSCTVSGGNITAVTPAPGVTRAEALRALSGLGTMATQHADAVAITGGTATGLAGFSNPSGDAYLWGLRVGSGTVLTQQGQLEVAGLATFVGTTSAPPVTVLQSKTVHSGMEMRAASSDTGNPAIAFFNIAGGYVGGITTTATAVAYNTTSDGRLKEAITTLAGALDVIRALRPVAFRWQADQSQGHGFLAHELQQVIPDAVTGEPDAVNDDGSIKPQQVDHSKLVPWLTSAVQALLARVETLEAQVEARA